MTETPSILLLTDKFPPHAGGTSVIYHQWCERLPAERLRVLTCESDGWREFNAQAAYPVERVAFTDWPKVRWPLVWWRLYRTASRRAPQTPGVVVHCGHVLETGLSGWRLKRRFGIPYVVHAYGEELLYYGRRRLTRGWLRRVLAEADGITAISAYTREQLATFGVPPERVILQPPGVDCAQFRPGLDGSGLRERLGLGECPTLITVARLLRRKGVDITLEAVARLRAEFSDLAYLVIGDGPELPRLREIAASLRIEDCVHFLGRVPHAETAECYAAADVFAHPNRQTAAGDVEGFGLVFLEANACGLPVVGGDSGGTPDAIRSGETGFLVDGTSVPAVAEAIGELLRNRDLRRRLGEAGRAWAERFTWERAAERVWRMTEMVHAGRPVTAESLALEMSR